MGRALDIVAGMLFGGVIWIILSVVLTFLPIVGWIFAALIGGYIAGRTGGGIAAVLLAIIAPVVTWIVLQTVLMLIVSLIPIPLPDFIQALLSSALATLVAIWALINLIFVGVGGAIGSKSYRSANCPYCRERITKQAVVCPSCGRDLKYRPREAVAEVPTAKSSVEDQGRIARLQVLSRLRNRVGFPFEETELSPQLRVDIGKATSALTAAEHRKVQHDAERAALSRRRDHVQPEAYARAITWFGVLLLFLTIVWVWYNISGMFMIQDVFLFVVPPVVLAVFVFVVGRILESRSRGKKLETIQQQNVDLEKQHAEAADKDQAEIEKLIEDLANRVLATFNIETPQKSAQQPEMATVKGKAKFCSECGKSLRPLVKFCPACGVRVPEKIMM